jgi:hypothetical protein
VTLISFKSRIVLSFWRGGPAIAGSNSVSVFAQWLAKLEILDRFRHSRQSFLDGRFVGGRRKKSALRAQGAIARPNCVRARCSTVSLLEGNIRRE